MAARRWSRPGSHSGHSPQRAEIAALEDARVIYLCDESHNALPEQPVLGVYHLEPGKDESSIRKVYLETVSAPFPF